MNNNQAKFDEIINLENDAIASVKDELGDSEMNAIIERLKLEKIESSKEYFDIGFAAGIQFVKTASYAEIYKAAWLCIEGCNCYWEGFSAGSIFAEKHWKITEYLRNISEIDGLYYSPTLSLDSCHNLAVDMWVRGWTKAVRGFYFAISRKMLILPAEMLKSFFSNYQFPSMPWHTRFSDEDEIDDHDKECSSTEHDV